MCTSTSFSNSRFSFSATYRHASPTWSPRLSCAICLVMGIRLIIGLSLVFGSIFILSCSLVFRPNLILILRLSLVCTCWRWLLLVIIVAVVTRLLSIAITNFLRIVGVT